MPAGRIPEIAKPAASIKKSSGPNAEEKSRCGICPWLTRYALLNALRTSCSNSRKTGMPI